MSSFWHFLLPDIFVLAYWVSCQRHKATIPVKKTTLKSTPLFFLLLLFNNNNWCLFFTFFKKIKKHSGYTTEACWLSPVCLILTGRQQIIHASLVTWHISSHFSPLSVLSSPSLNLWCSKQPHIRLSLSVTLFQSCPLPLRPFNYVSKAPL